MSPRDPLSYALVRFGPHDGAHRVAIRAAISIAVPLLVLLLLGRLDWSIYAVFGAFTSVYGRGATHGVRLRMQLTVGAVQTLCVVGGVLVGLSPARAWLIVPTAAALAGVVAAISDARRWQPPGPLFAVFALTACASFPTTTGMLLPAALVTGGAAGVSVLVGAIGGFRPGRGFADTEPRHPVEGRHVLRATAGVLIAGTIATAIGIGHPYWAMVSAVVPLMAREVMPQFVRGVQRVVGTFGGLAIAGLLLWWSPPAIVVVLIVIALQAVAELLVARNYAVALLFITTQALLMVNLAAPLPVPQLLADRAIETVVGVAVGLAVGYLTRRRPADPTV
ncbi:FUSC family protein [Microbacterium gorillae]|uniref:FUSC family protein n=1 Tax=Microbacterium gorillae TaxID=1231063 RepID=UPI00058FD6AA|nr:FUSC family protein [Microbacterium gorillae]